MDTIFALASGQGRAGVAVIRVSGPKSRETVGRIAGPILEPRRLFHRKLRTAEGELIDSGLVVVFDEGKSFTGESSAEFMVHGSRASVAALEQELASIAGVRHAEPGEFTRRALLHGKLDLTQVEALADLIDAETQGQRRQALRLLDGALGRKVSVWRQALVKSAALLEASIDFSDEDLGEFSEIVVQKLMLVLEDLEQELAGVRGRERVRSGFEVAIVGPPNIGKSTLLNHLAGREAAITSHRAGTTRDVVEVRMEVGGFPVTLLDTAGIRETDDDVEKLGIDRAISRSQSADLRIILTEMPGAETAIDPHAGDLIYVGKGDLPEAGPSAVSGITGVGVDGLLRALEGRLLELTEIDGVAVRERHHSALSEARDALSRAVAGLVVADPALEVVAFDVRSAMLELDMLIGKVDVEDLLDDIFSSFCIGK